MSDQDALQRPGGQTLVNAGDSASVESATPAGKSTLVENPYAATASSSVSSASVGKISRVQLSDVSASADPPPTRAQFIQRVADGIGAAQRDSNGVAANADQAVGRAANSTGSALPTPIQRKFEASTGADLSGVRVHTGADSAAAASAVGAKAYTTGQDIHFGAGHAPGGGGSEHLLAHEVAHTVQQQGASPTRQDKSEVSTPNDPLEHEADTAASAMITGAPAMISRVAGGVSRMVMRDPTPTPGATPPPGGAPAPAASDDKAWATDARTKVEGLQSAVSAATSALNQDASGAVGAFQQARQTCQTFETQFNDAKSNFLRNVKEALEQQKQFEEMLNQTFEVVLAVGSLGGSEYVEAYEAVNGVVGKVNTFAALCGTGKAGGGGGEGGGASSPGAMGIPQAPGSGQSVDPAGAAGSSSVNWKDMVDRVLGTLKTYTEQNSGLGAIASACIASDRWLTSVVEGHGPKNAQQSPDGVTATKLANASGDQANTLTSIGKQLTPPAQKFAAGIQTDLKAHGLGDTHKIEQDIAIKWLSQQKTGANGRTVGGKMGRGSSDIHASRDYLEKLGVLGKGGRTGVDVGLWDTDVDDDVIVARARVENQAMQLVGKGAEWQGGKVNGMTASGTVLSGENETWKAVGQAQQNDASMGSQTTGLTASAGGNVRVMSYSIAPISDDAKNAPDAMRDELLRGLVTLTVAANGRSTGGGAVGPQPTIGPARGGGGGE